MASRSKTKTLPPPAAVRKKQRSSEEIMTRLIAAATEEFQRSGFAGATTATIARNAEVTEAQLFRYFASKADLFREAVFEPLNRHFSEFNARNPTGDAGDESIRDQARLYIEELQQFLGEHSKSLMSLAVAQLFTPGSVRGIGEIESLRHYFDQGSAMMANRVGEHPQVDPRLMVRVSFAAVLGCVLFKDWIFPEDLASDEQISAATVDFVIDGISVNTDPGLE